MSSAGLTRALDRREFRRFFLGITLSRIGDAMTFTVVAWLALGAGGPAAVGYVVLAAGVTTPLAAPVIGALLDRAGLRRVLFADNLGRALLLLTLAVLARSGPVRLLDLLLITVVSALLSPATEIGQNVAVPVLVEDDELTAANTLLATSWDTAAWLGPAIAGLALARLGAAPVLVLDAVTFLAMAAVALTLPERPDHPAGSGPGGVLSGFRILLGLRPVLVISLVTVGNLFLAGMVEVFLPAFTGLTLHAGAARYGLLVSIAGLTGLAGTLLLTPVVDRLRPGPALMLVLAVRGLALLPLAAAGSWALAAVVVALAAVPDGPFYPISRTVQQRLIPAAVAGRVQGARGALGVAGFPLGGAVGGIAVAALGAGPTVVLMAAGYVALAVVLAATPSVLRLSTVDAGAAAGR
jgi:predicted MFS family arabinose efflux permease